MEKTEVEVKRAVLPNEIALGAIGISRNAVLSDDLEGCPGDDCNADTGGCEPSDTSCGQDCSCGADT